MKKCFIFFGAVVFFATVAFAAGPAQYQVTGNVVDVKDDVIIVQKGSEKFEIARDKAATVSGGDIKVGSKVTVFYTMKAEKIEVKGGPGGMKPEMPKTKTPTMPKM